MLSASYGSIATTLQLENDPIYVIETKFIAFLSSIEFKSKISVTLTIS